MTYTMEEVEKHLLRHRIALFASVSFLVLLSIAVIFQSSMIQTAQENPNRTYAMIAISSTPAPIAGTSPTPAPTGGIVVPKSNFYLRTMNQMVAASPNIATTTTVACNSNDVAISGGLDGYSGSLSKWRTITSKPDPVSQNQWIVTVLNQDSVIRYFSLTAKCLQTK